MPRVLIVTSMFLPYLAADVHRARILARELPRIGWEVELLVPGDSFQLRDYFEPHSELLRVSVPIHRAEPQWEWLFRLLGWRSLGWRAYRPLRSLGDSLLAGGRFDLVYFSCSQPTLLHLGVGWRARHGTPFVIDLHDPWYTPELPTPRHLSVWKRRVTNYISKFTERATVARAAGIVSVSVEYIETLNRRFAGEGWEALSPQCQATIPFAASEEDVRAAEQLSLASPTARAGSPAMVTVVYTGAGGTIMEESLREICRHLLAVKAGNPKLLAGVRIWLFGTEPSAPPGEAAVTRVVTEMGLSDLITEFPARLSYLDALRHVVEADGLLILGVDDPAYVPSKLFLYALSGKPLLACLRSGTTVDGYFASMPAMGRCIHFGSKGEAVEAMDQDEVEGFLVEASNRVSFDRRRALDSHSAAHMAALHAELFESCLGKAR
ncbi:MAG: glycosyltransferase [Thermoanaerobaculia bacterium]